MSGDAVETYFTIKLIGIGLGLGIAALFVFGLLGYYVVMVVREKLSSRRRWREESR
jgi:hypothetical protein